MKHAKTLMYLTCAILLSGCSTYTEIAEHSKMYRIWRETVLSEYKSDAPRAVYVKHQRGSNTDSNEYNYTMVYANGYTAYINDDWQTYQRFDDSSVIYIDILNRDLMIGKAGESFYEGQYDQTIIGKTMYFAQIVGLHDKRKPKSLAQFARKIALEWHMVFSGVRDTLLDGTGYKIFQVKKQDEYLFNQETHKYDIPRFHIIDYYFNTADKSIDKVVVMPEDPSNPRIWKEVFFIRTDFNINPDTLTRDIFDTSSVKYMGFSRNDDRNPPYSLRPLVTKVDSTAEDLLKYPLVDMNGDTTTVLQQDGWLLLDFWIFGCPGCRRQHMEWKKEQKTDGITTPEREGITVLSINPVSDNSEYIAREAVEFCPDGTRMFHAKGINVHLKTNAFPQYYLISPDKSIVYRSGPMIDYDQLLKSLHQYTDEKTNKK